MTFLCLAVCLALAVCHSASTAQEFSGLYTPEYIMNVYHYGLERLREKAHSDYCKSAIEWEYMKQFRTLSEERPFPFEDAFYHSQCDAAWHENPPLLPVLQKEIPTRPALIPLDSAPQNPYRDSITGEVAVELNPEDVSLLYVILAHEYPAFIERLIHALDEPLHSFVIHVDEKASETYEKLVDFAKNWSTQGKVYVMEKGRQRVNWGGYSVVNATLTAIEYATEELKLDYEYLIVTSGTTYPIQSNEKIRQNFAKRPGTVYMDVHSSPARPGIDMHYMYVECDDALHRISRLAPLRGMNMHIGSQWFALPRHVVHWFLHNDLPQNYKNYAQYVVVADENYFATLFKNSPYCKDLVPSNLLFILFDKWEAAKNPQREDRDARKCLHPDPDHCGRSPTTMTMEYKRLLQASEHLFARKFDPTNELSMRLVDEIDKWRTDPKARTTGVIQNFMIRQYEIGSEMTARINAVKDAGGDNNANANANVEKALPDFCMTMGSQMSDQLHMSPCDARNERQWFTFGTCTGSAANLISLSQETCGMFSYGTISSNLYDTSSSSESESESDHSIKFEENDEVVVTSDEKDTYCQIRPMRRENGAASNWCLDISGENPYPGAKQITWECTGNWNQLWHYSRDCTISAVQPGVISELREMKKEEGSDGGVTVCLETGTDTGVYTGKCAGSSYIVGNNTDTEAEVGTVMIEPEKESIKYQILPAEGDLWKMYNVLAAENEEL